MPKKKRRKRTRTAIPKVVERYEIETIFGLERHVANEFAGMRIGARVSRSTFRSGRFSVTYEGPPSALLESRSAVAVHRVLSFPLPRPTGLLGDESLKRLAVEAWRITGQANRKGFKTLSISAAGRDTSVFQRLSGELCNLLGLVSSEETGDLALAVRPAVYGKGWEVLVRLTQRPLSARSWRVCDMPGALDATLAHLAVSMTGPSPRQRFLNIACGSSTMLIERLASWPAKRAVGIDIDPEAISCSERNIAAAGMTDQIDVLKADMTDLPFKENSFEAIVGDLPFGMLVKGSQSNAEMYPKLLGEAARISTPSALISLVTTDHNSMSLAFDAPNCGWNLLTRIELRVPSKRGYITPAIYVAELVS